MEKEFIKVNELTELTPAEPPYQKNIKLLPCPVGITSYKEVSQECYYVDKTLLIKDIIDEHNKVYLFTRPRRFGKTLTMDMIRTYFENTNTFITRLIINCKLAKNIIHIVYPKKRHHCDASFVCYMVCECPTISYSETKAYLSKYSLTSEKWKRFYNNLYRKYRIILVYQLYFDVTGCLRKAECILQTALEML